MVKDHTVIWPAWEVRAYLAGLKTQFRRPINFHWPYNNPANWTCSREEICPFGAPGGRLIVKETWVVDEDDQEVVFYRATDHESCGQPWRSAATMPRRFFRITLDVLRVWPQRVCEISEEEAIAEGIQKWTYDYGSIGYGIQQLALGVMESQASHAYQRIWEHTKSTCSYPWGTAWCWAVEFPRYKP